MPSIQCRKCLAVIKSTHRHDFVWCDCKSVAIDGGKDYTRIIGSPDDVIMRQENKMKFEVPVWIEVEADDADAAWEDTIRLMAGLELYKTHQYTVMEPTKIIEED